HAPGPQPSGIVRRPVAVDWFRLVVPRDDSLEDDPVDLATLGDRPFIASPTNMSCGRCVIQACREVGFEPAIRHQIDDYNAAMRLVAAGAGVALLPDLALVHGVPPGVRVLDLADPICRVIELAHRTASSGRPGLEAVCDAVAEVAAEMKLDTHTPTLDRHRTPAA
ncbi:MAG: LysR substrate-binding domain-containing protein, partial [Actinomycetota bacterium]